MRVHNLCNAELTPVKGVSMNVGRDFSRDPAIADAAFLQSEEHRIGFRVDGIFAAYMADAKNPELAEFIADKAKEIREFIAKLERRISVPLPAESCPR